jgi:glc operon protein GlcG
VARNDMVVTQTNVALGPALECVQAGLAKAGELGVRVGIVVVDTNGNTVVAVRMDGSGGRADHGARGKAVFSAGLGVSSAAFIENRLQHNEALWRALSSRQDIFVVQGGFPLKYEGRCVGAVGVSGAKHEEDSQVSEAVANRFTELVEGSS